jgi:hypothetical protein
MRLRTLEIAATLPLESPLLFVKTPVFQGCPSTPPENRAHVTVTKPLRRHCFQLEPNYNAGAKVIANHRRVRFVFLAFVLAACRFQISSFAPFNDLACPMLNPVSVIGNQDEVLFDSPSPDRMLCTFR